MSEGESRRDYLTTKYLEYQKQYAGKLRESDKVLIALIKETMSNYPKKNHRLLEVGCSSGNLILHLKKALPMVEFHGIDLFPEIIEVSKSNPDLSDVIFNVMDVRNLTYQDNFDFIVMNAVLSYFKGDELNLVISNVARVTDSGGWLFAFSPLNPFEQEIHIIEISTAHPREVIFNFHSYLTMEKLLRNHGFANLEFRPFSIPIDLDGGNDFRDLKTYTIRTAQGERLNFRGSLFQPWCHLKARKE